MMHDGTVFLNHWRAFAAALIFSLALGVAWAAPLVSNITAGQREDGSGIVDISYDVSGGVEPMTVSLRVSPDNGQTWTFTPPPSSLEGDAGSGVTNGSGKSILWNAARDLPDIQWPETRVLVTAIDGVPNPMVTVPAGSFTMGRRDGESGDYDELPRHTVTLSTYTIGKYEVTNEQYCAVLNWALGQGYLKDSNGGPYAQGDVYANGQVLLDMPPYDDSTSDYCAIIRPGTEFEPEKRDDYSMADHPVTNVSWYGAVMFCNWLSEMAGLQPAYVLWALVDADVGTAGQQFTNGYRLPTEAEWERAAGWDTAASKHWIYCFGSDTISSSRCNYASFVNPLGLSAIPYTSPVGWFNGVNVSPNGNTPTQDAVSPAGCYDMSGNLWEMCHDWYGLYTSSPLTDPVGPSSGTFRVLRGGSWTHDAVSCRSVNRDTLRPVNADRSVGFRLSRSE